MSVKIAKEQYWIKVNKVDTRHWMYSGPGWKTVSRSEFARHEGESLISEDTDDARMQIAVFEGVSKKLVTKVRHTERDSMYIACTGVDSIKEAMEYTKSRATKVSYQPGYYNVRDLSRDSKIKMVSLRRVQAVILENNWVVQGNKLSYDPGKVSELELENAKKIANDRAWKLKNNIVDPVRSSIPIGKLMHPLFRILYDLAAKRLGLERKFPTGRSWHNWRLININSPSKRRDYIWTIPQMIDLCDRLYSNHPYRNKVWKKHFQTLNEKHMEDKAMTKELRNLVRREVRAFGKKVVLRKPRVRRVRAR